MLYCVGNGVINHGTITLTCNPCDIVLERGYFFRSKHYTWSLEAMIKD